MSLNDYMFRIRFLDAGPLQVKGIKMLDQHLRIIRPTYTASSPITAGSLAAAWAGTGQGLTLALGVDRTLTWRVPHREQYIFEDPDSTAYLDEPVYVCFLGLQTDAPDPSVGRFTYEVSNDAGATWRKGSSCYDVAGKQYMDDAASFDWWNLKAVGSLRAPNTYSAPTNSRWRVAVTRIENITDPALTSPASGGIAATLGQYSLSRYEGPYNVIALNHKSKVPDPPEGFVYIDYPYPMVSTAVVLTSGDKPGFPISNLKDNDPATYWQGTSGNVSFLTPPRFIEFRWQKTLFIPEADTTLITPGALEMSIFNPPAAALGGAMREALLQQWVDGAWETWTPVMGVQDPYITTGGSYYGPFSPAAQPGSERIITWAAIELFEGYEEFIEPPARHPVFLN